MKLLVVLGFIGLISVSIACKCAVQSVEKYFCSSEFAIKIKVTSEKKTTGDQLQASHEIQVLEVYKTDDKTKTALSSNRIWTAESSAACGRYFEVNKVYVITGTVDETDGKARTNSCTFGKNVEELSAEEKEFFTKGYKSVTCNKST